MLSFIQRFSCVIVSTGNIIHRLVVKELVDVESISETVVAGVDDFVESPPL